MSVLHLQESVPVDRERQLLKDAKNECLEQIGNGRAEPTEMLILSSAAYLNLKEAELIGRAK